MLRQPAPQPVAPTDIPMRTTSNALATSNGYHIPTSSSSTVFPTPTAYPGQIPALSSTSIFPPSTSHSGHIPTSASAAIFQDSNGYPSFPFARHSGGYNGPVHHASPFQFQPAYNVQVPAQMPISAAPSAAQMSFLPQNMYRLNAESLPSWMDPQWPGYDVLPPSNVTVGRNDIAAGGNDITAGRNDLAVYGMRTSPPGMQMSPSGMQTFASSHIPLTFSTPIRASTIPPASTSTPHLPGTSQFRLTDYNPRPQAIAALQWMAPTTPVFTATTHIPRIQGYPQGYGHAIDNSGRNYGIRVFLMSPYRSAPSLRLSPAVPAAQFQNNSPVRHTNDGDESLIPVSSDPLANATLSAIPPNQGSAVGRRSSRLAGPEHEPTGRRPCPADAEQWFSVYYNRLTKTELGIHFDAVLNGWLRMEEASLFRVGDWLPMNLCPAQVTTWLRAKSDKDTKVAANKLGGFIEAMNVWWDSMQPAWRRRSSNGSWQFGGAYGGGGKEWGELYTWGPGGVVGIVAGLYISGRAIPTGTQNEHRDAWEMLVMDVGWMLEGMALYYERWGKKGTW
ncbi:hypothetical protein C8F01DRAFT_1142343 [Mycena amicta]|nr:hypothetical protein C8F01DRAFT_1142343 [Mycena amicta]